MVEYSDWVGIVRRVASRKGADLSDFEENSAVVSVAADIWNDRKRELQQASQSRAEEIASAEVNVS